jgi:hypothetical protein
MTNEYKPTSPLLRSAFLAAALTITIAVGAFIDNLAQPDTEGTAQLAAPTEPAAVARG